MWHKSLRFVPIILLALGITTLALSGGNAQGGQPPTSTPNPTRTSAVAEELSNAFANAAQRAMPAVVYISVEGELGAENARQPNTEEFQFQDPFDFFRDSPFEHFFRELPRERRETPSPRRFLRGQGSGFLVSSDGLILTDNHVVAKASSIKVRLHDGRQLDAKLVGTDPESDVALIRVAGTGFPHLKLGDSSALRVGEWVVAVGNPFGLNETVTSGIVSAKGRTHVGLNNYENFIQTDAAINPGNSGGPLLNLRGEVVGINAAIYSRSGGYMGIGFAIPINFAKAIQGQLEHGGKVVRGFLGVMVQDLTSDLAHSLGSDVSRGALIAEVTENSPAGKAGLLAGDIVVGLDGTALRDAGMLRNEIALRKPGTDVQLDVIRNGKHRTVAVSLAQRDGQAVARTPTEPDEDLGLAVEPLTADLARRMGTDLQHGVVIGRVRAGSRAARAGLRPGEIILDVNRKPVDNPKMFDSATSDAHDAKQILLRVYDGQSIRYVVIRLD